MSKMRNFLPDIHCFHCFFFVYSLYLTVSNIALCEYENLHEKFEVEQSCRTKAEEFATNVCIDVKYI